MVNQTPEKQSLVKNLLYRATASITILGSFFVAQYLGKTYLEAGIYAGWIGLAGGVATLMIMRVLFGSFKRVEYENIPASEVTNTKLVASTQNAVTRPLENFSPATASINPTFNANTAPRPDFALTAAQQPQQPVVSPQSIVSASISPETSPQIEKIRRELEIIAVKEQKLDGIRANIDRMDSRLYQVLKRQYALERDFLESDLKTEVEKLFENPSTPVPQASAMEPQLSDEKTEPVSNTPILNEQTEDSLLNRFQRLDNLLTTRLNLMKARSKLKIVESNENEELSEGQTIEYTA